MRTYIAYPPLQKSSGGTAVLENMARHLLAAGHDVVMVPRDPATAPPLSGLPLHDWNKAAPDTRDIWLVPEGWPSLLLPGLHARARTVIYVQNWAYLPGSVPDGLCLTDLPLHLLAVSQPVAWHAHAFFGKADEILRPGIDLNRFFTPPRDPAQALNPDGTVRIAWMPRKNKALAQQIRDMLTARLALRGLPSPEWIPVHQLTQDQVAETLRSCHIFLASGFPEGCPLPPLEAMACGCLVVGFGGFGGWDYMRQAWPDGCTPWWPLRPAGECPWGGNGLYAADADTIAAALALEYGLALLADGGKKLADIRAAAEATAAAYSLQAQEARLRELWSRVEKGVALPAFLG